MLSRLKRSSDQVRHGINDLVPLVNVVVSALEHTRNPGEGSGYFALEEDIVGFLGKLSPEEINHVLQEYSKISRLLSLLDRELLNCTILSSEAAAPSNKPVLVEEMPKEEITIRKLAALLSENEALHERIQTLEDEAYALRQKILSNDDIQATNEYQTHELVELKVQVANLKEENIKLHHQLKSSPPPPPAAAATVEQSHYHLNNLFGKILKGKQESHVSPQHPHFHEQMQHVIEPQQIARVDEKDVKYLEAMLIEAKVQAAQNDFDHQVMISEMKTLARRLSATQAKCSALEKLHGQIQIKSDGSSSNNNNNNHNQESSVGDHKISAIFTPTLIGHEEADALLSPAQIELIHHALPIRFQFSDWQLLFATNCHGFNLGTLYRRVVQLGPVIIVVKDENGSIFGAYASDSLKLAEEDKHSITRSSKRYFGNGETFVFSSHTVYTWAKENDFFVCCKPDLIAFGGGSNFALSIDPELSIGSSGHCETFNSPCLSSNSPYSAHSVQVWGIEAVVSNLKRHGVQKVPQHQVFRSELLPQT